MTDSRGLTGGWPTVVEVWCASLDRWVRGFDLVSADDDACIVRRRSDGEVLPVAFSPDQVRPGY